MVHSVAGFILNIALESMPLQLFPRKNSHFYSCDSKIKWLYAFSFLSLDFVGGNSNEAVFTISISSGGIPEQIYHLIILLIDWIKFRRREKKDFLLSNKYAMTQVKTFKCGKKGLLHGKNFFFNANKYVRFKKCTCIQTSICIQTLVLIFFRCLTFYFKKYIYFSF